MVLSNAERQARYRAKLQETGRMAYEIEVLKKQVGALESALNEVRAKAGLSEIQLPKPAKRARVIEDGPLKGAVYMGLRKAP